jgi:TPR repeat protein
MRNKISRSLIIATLTLSFTEIKDVAFAGPFEDSMAAYDRGDYATMLQLLRPLAERGNAQAQNSLGAMYYEGEGVAENFVRSHMWLNIAAAQGDPDAARMRDIVSKGMTAQQLTEAQAMALKCATSNYKQCD